jgi:hypothetical protein
MSTETAKALERVRKLLALAGNNPNEEEAARAAEKAHAILAEHNLSVADIKTDDQDETIVEDEELVTNSQPWRRQIGTATAAMYFCEYLYQRLPLHRDRHSFVGKRHNVEVAKMFFTYLHMTVNRLAQEGALKRAPALRSAYRTEFRRACTSRLAYRIHKRIEEAKRGQLKTEGGKNLPALINVYEAAQKQIESFIEQEYGKDAIQTKQARNVSTKVRDDDAKLDGWRAGDAIGLDAQLKRDEVAAITAKPVERHVVTYGTATRPKYCVMRASDRLVVFRSDSKSECILSAQKLMGFTPADGDEQTYGRQIAEMGWR